jgi:hypothetical protein
MLRGRCCGRWWREKERLVCVFLGFGVDGEGLWELLGRDGLGESRRLPCRHRERLWKGETLKQRE